MDDQALAERITRLSTIVGELERKVDFLLKELKIDYHDDPASNIPPQLSQVYAFLQQGKKLEAIKEYREKYGVGLAEAKAAVERIEMGAPPK
ncbi:MAG: hypothetical protein WCF84_13020 [Anaerolineae bacterium]